MKISIEFTGRRVGALGIMHSIGLFHGEGDTAEKAIDDARQKAYAGGFEHVLPARWRQTSHRFGQSGFTFTQTPVYTELSS
jgi:hypothetical protein